MEKHSITDISVDSLEEDFNKKASTKDTQSDENVETILVPFYEKDVLIKVPKDQIRKTKPGKTKLTDKQNIDSQQVSSYFLNKDEYTKQKAKRKTYLERFRQQFLQNRCEKIQREEIEIRSISPEVGDTERGSFGEDQSTLVEEFYNTESYNEIYYEKLLQQQLDDYLEEYSEEGVHFNEDLGSKSPNDNLRSVSEVSQPRRRSKRTTVIPVDVKLGGLGPDVEKIKPRLERARSLQRYSEKVRMENRLRIYKKSIQDEDQKKKEREMTTKRNSAHKHTPRNQVEDNASYLVNKCTEEKTSKSIKQIYDSKCKSATRKGKDNRTKQDEQKVKSACKKSENTVEDQKYSSREARSRIVRDREEKTISNDAVNVRVKSSARSKVIHTEISPVSSDIPPVHISFLVNVGGLRPSSALRTLEEKHQHYKEQVKAYMNNND